MSSGIGWLLRRARIAALALSWLALGGAAALAASPYPVGPGAKTGIIDPGGNQFGPAYPFPVAGTAVVGFGVLSLTNASTALSTLTLGPNSGAWSTAGVVYVLNRSASAGNAYVCPLAGACTAATGLELVPGQVYGFTRPATGMTVIAASTATVEAQW